MNIKQFSEKFTILLLITISLYFFFFQSGKMALSDPDETFYAETAKEMLEKNEWSTPYLYGKPQFEKPIMIYWLVEISYKIFGVNEFAARFPSGLFAFLGVIGMYLLGSILFSKRAGALSAVIMAASVEYVILSRACVTDMTLFTFMLFGAFFFFKGYFSGKTIHYILSSAALGLAVLTKGPIAIILFAAAIILYLLFTKQIKSIVKIPIWWMAVIFLAVASPWYIVAYKLHGSALINEFFGFHNVTRFVQSEHAIGSQFYYNIPILLGGMFPWSVFLPLGFWHIFKKAVSKDAKESGGSIFILSWFTVIFGFFSVSSTKLPTYIFPSFVSASLMAGVLWDDFLKEDAPQKLKKRMSVSYYSLMVIVVLGVIGALVYIVLDYPSILKGVAISSIFLMIGMGISFIFFRRKNYIPAFFLIVYALIIFLYPMNMLVIPEIERYETSKEISLKLLTMMKPEERLGSESNYLAGLAFYTGKFPVNLDKHQEIINLLDSKERVWLIMKEKNHRQLYELDMPPWYSKPSYMLYKIGKRAIVTNNFPEDGKYLIKRERIK